LELTNYQEEAIFPIRKFRDLRVEDDTDLSIKVMVD
jgi:hypothetical protein